MAAKINWHKLRYGTKLRHCHPMYRLHPKVTGLRISISHGPRPNYIVCLYRHSRLAGPLAGRLDISVLNRHPHIWLIMCKYDVILKKPEVHNVSQRRQRKTGPWTYMHKTLLKIIIRRVVPEISRTDVHGHHNTSPPTTGGEVFNQMPTGVSVSSRSSLR